MTKIIMYTLIAIMIIHTTVGRIRFVVSFACFGFLIRVVSKTKQKYSLASKCRPTERRKTRFSEGKLWVFWLFNTGCEQHKAKRLPCIAKNAVLGGLILHSHCCVFLQQQSMHTSLFLPPFFFFCHILNHI